MLLILVVLILVEVIKFDVNKFRVEINDKLLTFLDTRFEDKIQLLLLIVDVILIVLRFKFKNVPLLIKISLA